jgi:cell division inhibitor SulA/protein ImuA
VLFVAHTSAAIGICALPFVNPALAQLLSHPAIWRGNDCAPEPSSIATGFAELDRALPGGGWPRGALTEVALEREGIGELRLTLPALARLQAEGRSVVFVSPPYRPYAPALAAAGLDLSRLVVVRSVTGSDALWAYEQALRAPECGAAFAWTATHDERVLRRLQVAARDGRTWAVLWRRPGQRAAAQAAPLRLALAPSAGRLAVRVVKRRGVELARPIVLDLAHAPGAPLYPLPEGRLSTKRTSSAMPMPRRGVAHRKAS